MKQSNLIGVDVSEASIKVLQLDTDNTIVAYGSTAIPVGVVKSGSIVDQNAFSVALNNVLEKTVPKVLRTSDSVLEAVLCLPESKLFSHHCVLPKETGKSEQEEYIKQEAQKIIPFTLDNLYWKYHVAEEGEVINATFMGVVKSDLDNYVKAFTFANVKPAFVGGELFAIGRALLPDPPLEGDYIILDIGAYSTTIGIFSVDAIPNESIIVQQGGKYLTQYLSEWLGVSLEEAESSKIKYGVDPAYEDTNVPKLLREALTPLIEKLIGAKAYFEKKSGNPISHIIIAGGSALLPQLNFFINEKVGVETVVADPLKRIMGRETLSDDIPEIFFTNVIGLALSANYSGFSHINLLSLYEDDKKEIANESLEIKEIRSISDLYYATRVLMRRMKEYIARSQIVTELRDAKLNLKFFLTFLFLVGASVLLVWVIMKYL